MFPFDINNYPYCDVVETMRKNLVLDYSLNFLSLCSDSVEKKDELFPNLLTPF